MFFFISIDYWTKFQSHYINSWFFGTNIPGNNLRTLRVNNVDIISSPVAHTGDNDTAAAAIALAINNTTSTPNYTGSSSNNSVTITSDTRGTGSSAL